MKRTSNWLTLIILMAISSFALTYFWSEIDITDNETINGVSVNQTEGPDNRPSDWAWERRTFPYYKADAEYFRDQMNYASQLRKNSISRGLDQLEFGGPTNIGGRVTDIEFNPQNPNIVYAGAATGGVFKSTDMGYSWFPVFDDQAILTIGDIVVDPNNSDIVYVGTGEANGGHNNFPGGGVYKSADAGNSWELIGLENTVSIGRVVVDPTNSDRVFVAAQGSYFTTNPERGVYRSEDGGDTWTNILYVSDSTGAIDLIMDPSNPQNIMVAMWERVRRPEGSHLYGATSGLYRSFDGGDNWEYIQPNGVLPDAQQENVGRIGIALCKDQPNTVYAMYTDGSYYSGFFRSDDFGTTWTNADPDMEISYGTSSFSWYFGQVRVHPENPDIVFAMDVAYMRSVDGGNSWPIIYGYDGGPWDFHVDQHALAFNPDNPDYIISGNDGGMNISTDGGVNFTKVAELPINQFYEIGLDRNNPQKLYGGTQDNGTLRTNTGSTNDWDRIYGGDGFYVIVDYTNPNIIFAESQNGNLGKSYDGGNSFYWATNGISDNEPKNWSTPVVMDPKNPSVMYYGTNHLYRSTNAADYWYSISPDLTNGYTGNRPGTISTIDVSPVNTDIIYVGTSDSRVWVSMDNGSNWTDISGDLPHRWVSRVVADHNDENVAYVTFTGLKWADPEPHVFRTDDNGETWTDISSNLPDAPINAFAVDHIDNNYLFVGTDLGAYYSSNLGESWEYLDADLPMVTVYDLKIHKVEHYLAIGTHARSIYKLGLDQIVGIEESEIEAYSNLNNFKNYPNPFSNTTEISFDLEKTKHIKVDVFDIKGRKLSTLLDKKLNAGNHTINWEAVNDNGQALSPAYYFCKISLGQESKTIKMLKVK
ncbi:MAG: hypothetical protein C0598_11275 [Marinilabiliales bacterium]|nr:MAG: hypothetical protein C0598_11275 [Marinilabiliales bacterium]